MNIDEAMYDEGYDTDGNIGPFNDPVEHEEDLSPPFKRRVRGSDGMARESCQQQHDTPNQK
eukprot:15356280-Ditylum_brightwellii.AAC.1